MFRILLHDSERRLSPELLKQMFHLRHRVFKEMLDWEVTSTNDMERDDYDRLDPIYCVCVDDGDHVIGCWRLLRTVNPYLLRDVFPILLGTNPPPSSSNVWEASRFAFYPSKAANGSLGDIQRGTSSLIAALLETGVQYGIERIIAVSELRFERILTRSGLTTHRFAPPIQIGNTKAVAGWFDVTGENLQRVRETGGLDCEVLEPRHKVHDAA
jgi:N-acyl-L-homoserine lactone synthetase